VQWWGAEELSRGGVGWRSIKRYRAHPLYDTRLEMDTPSSWGARKAPVFVWPSSGGELDSRPFYVSAEANPMRQRHGRPATPETAS
jgi:hypothetical protein